MTNSSSSTTHGARRAVRVRTATRFRGLDCLSQAADRWCGRGCGNRDGGLYNLTWFSVVGFDPATYAQHLRRRLPPRRHHLHTNAVAALAILEWDAVSGSEYLTTAVLSG